MSFSRKCHRLHCELDRYLAIIWITCHRAKSPHQRTCSPSANGGLFMARMKILGETGMAKTAECAWLDYHFTSRCNPQLNTLLMYYTGTRQIDEAKAKFPAHPQSGLNQVVRVDPETPCSGNYERPVWVYAPETGFFAASNYCTP